MARRDILDLMEQKREWTDERVQSGIELYRKGLGSITVKDKNGDPVKDAKIVLKQKNHEFRFGANIFMLDELESDEKNEKYKRLFADTFNMATLPFYWDATEPEKGKTRYEKDSSPLYRRPAIDLCMEFCEKNGIEPREHALAYEHFFPKWLYGASEFEVKRELERRYKEISERYASRIRTIEVTNEMAWEKGRTSFYDDPDYVRWCFELADKYFPCNQLVINETTSHCWKDMCRATDKYYSYIEANMLKGARIDAIGMQYHLFYRREQEYEKTRLTLDPESLYRHMDLYANFGKPLQITEVTVPAYSNDEEDEAIQAEIAERLYSIWFSHPAVEQIIYWNIIDGYAHLWDPDPEKIRKSQGDMSLGENYYYGGLLRFDMTPKPAYYAIKDLIEKKWHTETEVCTGNFGKTSFKGFFGSYDVEVYSNGTCVKTTVDLKKNQENNFELVI